MDKLLKPRVLETEPNESEAEQVYKHWLKTFECFLSSAEEARRNADNAPPLNKLSILFNHVSHRIYLYIEESATYEAAKAILDRIYLKPKNEIFARHLLTTTKQESDESLSEFARKLKERAKDCNFEAVTAEQHRDNMLRDAFIGGLSSSSIRQRLLEEQRLNFQEALNKAELLDRAQKQASFFARSHFLENANAKELNSITIRNRGSIPRKCFFCGEGIHPRGRNFCPAKDKTCFKCGKIGHFQSVCRSSRKTTLTAVLPDNDELETEYVTDNKNESSSQCPQLFSVAASAPDALKPTVVPCKLEGYPVDSLIDTGASENFMSESTANIVGLIPQGNSSKVSMASNAFSATVLGKVTSSLNIQGRTYPKLSFGVIPNLCADVILGQSFLNQHSEVLLKLKGTEKRLVVNREEFCGVSASNFDGKRLFKNLHSDQKPIATRSRKFNESDKAFIKNEVSHLLSEGVIEPSYSPWRAQVLVTKDDRHKRRMVVDYSQTINRYTVLDAYPLPNIDEVVAQIAKGRVYSTLDLKSAYYQIPLSPEDRPYTAFEACGKLYQYTRLPFGVTNGVSFFQRIVDELIEKYELYGTFAYLDNITVSGIDKNDHDFKLRALLNAAKAEGLTFNDSKCVYCRTEIDLLGYRISHNVIQPDPERLRPLLEMKCPVSKSELLRIIGMFSYYAKWIHNFSQKIRPLILVLF